MARKCKHGKKADGHCRKAPKSGGSCKCKTYQGCLSYIRKAAKFKTNVKRARAAAQEERMLNLYSGAR